MNKQLSTITGAIQTISKPVVIDRKDKPSFVKVTVGIKTKDQQLIFFEVRESNIQFSELVIGRKVSIDFYFAGSVKDDKLYNNIIALKMTSYDY